MLPELLADAFFPKKKMKIVKKKKTKSEAILKSIYLDIGKNRFNADMASIAKAVTPIK